MNTRLLPTGTPCEIQFILREDWSPEQAMAVVELLDDLRDAIYHRYQRQLRNLDYEQYNMGDPPDFENIDETDEPF